MASKAKSKRASARRAARPRAKRRQASRSGARSSGALVGEMKGAERRDIGHVRLDVGRAGAARIKRMIYPPGFRWSVDMKPIVGTDRCMHAHVGFLAAGTVHVEYGDGCTAEYDAPAVVAIEPEHDGWVVGSDPAVLIEFDFESDTIGRLGMPAGHTHG